MLGLLVTLACISKPGSTGLSETQEPLVAADSAVVEPADDDGDGVTNDEDCAPDDPSVHPGADEACDGVDQDCDGSVDEGVLQVAYSDLDGDEFGTGDAVEVCELERSQASLDGDCNDGDPYVFPGADERCNDADDDCDEAVDEGLGTSTWCVDADGDGYGDDGACMERCDDESGAWSATGGDCDDAEATTYAGAQESCDEVDSDCDGDLNDAGALGCSTTSHRDADGDGYLSVEAFDATECVCSTDPGDCDDADAAISPAATEACDGVDNDCDGLTDEGC